MRREKGPFLYQTPVVPVQCLQNTQRMERVMSPPGDQPAGCAKDVDIVIALGRMTQAKRSQAFLICF